MSLEKLSPYLPAGSLDYIEKILQPYIVIIKVTRIKKTKLGSFCPPRNNDKKPVIKVTSVANPYLFLITLIHEIAHLKTWTELKKRSRPHGKHWKMSFIELMSPILSNGVFPEELRNALLNHLRNPSASMTNDLHLLKALNVYSIKNPQQLTVEDVPEGSLFLWRTGRVFQKKEKLRKRYRCIETKTKQVYLFNPLAEVELVSN
jgi:SprT protein